MTKDEFNYVILNPEKLDISDTLLHPWFDNIEDPDDAKFYANEDFSLMELTSIVQDSRIDYLKVRTVSRVLTVRMLYFYYENAFRSMMDAAIEVAGPDVEKLLLDLRDVILNQIDVDNFLAGEYASYFVSIVVDLRSNFTDKRLSQCINDPQFRARILTAQFKTLMHCALTGHYPIMFGLSNLSRRDDKSFDVLRTRLGHALNCENVFDFSFKNYANKTIHNYFAISDELL